ncbi:retrovirus-related pol polyprotein from transposon TNT 1-94 [Tanacetum coccineum]
MTGAKFDIEKFDGTGDFGLWRIKMRVLLIQHGCEAAPEVTSSERGYRERHCSGGLDQAPENFVQDKVLCQQVLPEKKVGKLIAEIRISQGKVKNQSLGGEDSSAIFANLRINLKETVQRIIARQSTVTSRKMMPTKSPVVRLYDDSDVDDECDGGSVYPELRKNLISLGTLTEKEGFTVKDAAVAKVKSCTGWHKRLDISLRRELQVLEKQVCFGKRSRWNPLEYEELSSYALEWILLTFEQLRGRPQSEWVANETELSRIKFTMLLIQSGLPKTFWAEATCTVAYLINRTRNKPLRFRDESNMAAYAFAAAEEEDTHEPLTYQEAVACEDSSKWKAAMEEEMDSLRKNKTWELVDHPAGQKLVSCKWLFKIKEGIEGVQKPRYKARVVARGFTQRAGIDYNEVFSPVVRHTSIRVYTLQLTALKIMTSSLMRFDDDMLSNGFKRSSYDSSYITGVMHQSRQWKIGSESRVWDHFKLSLKDCPLGLHVKRMSKNHWEAVKWILKYLRGTVNVGLVYGTHRGNHGCVCKIGRQHYKTRGGLFQLQGGVYARDGGCEGSNWLRDSGRVGRGA